MEKQNSKYLNGYVFWSTFARKMIETYIPLMLFKFGYELKEVILFFALVMIISLFFSFPILHLSKRIGNQKVSFIGVIAFIIVQLMLAQMVHSIEYVCLLATIYSIYRRAYWIPRTYYTMATVPQDNTSKEYSVISVINQSALVLAEYAGAWLLTFLDNKYVMLISFSIFIFSTFSLMKIKDETQKSEKISVLKVIKECPKRNIHLMGTYQLLTITKFLFTLYIFINIKEEYLTVGILELISSLATMLFTYVYGKKINGKKDYLRLSVVLVALVYLAKVNVTATIPFAIICFVEGLVTKMYEVSTHKGFIKYSKTVGEYSANIIYELAQNLYRAVLMVMVWFAGDLKVMIYIAILMMLSGVLLEFKEEKN